MGGADCCFDWLMLVDEWFILANSAQNIIFRRSYKPDISTDHRIGGLPAGKRRKKKKRKKNVDNTFVPRQTHSEAIFCGYFFGLLAFKQLVVPRLRRSSATAEREIVVILLQCYNIVVASNIVLIGRRKISALNKRSEFLLSFTFILCNKVNLMTVLLASQLCYFYSCFIFLFCFLFFSVMDFNFL